jgi:RpiB/LacA/LacB family sugar-phosphate isomerase
VSIVTAADHAGLGLKRVLNQFLEQQGQEVVDVGTHDEKPVDYPDIAKLAANALYEGKARRGIVICGSGVGASIAANKLPGMRAGLCHDTYSARQGVEHDDMNVLVLGSRVIGPEVAKEVAGVFLDSCFDGVERHQRRVQKVVELDAGRARHT